MLKNGKIIFSVVGLGLFFSFISHIFFLFGYEDDEQIIFVTMNISLLIIIIPLFIYYLFFNKAKGLFHSKKMFFITVFFILVSSAYFYLLKNLPLALFDLSTPKGGRILNSLIWIYLYSICFFITLDRFTGIKSEKRCMVKP